jgi:hypothetical protein
LAVTACPDLSGNHFATVLKVLPPNGWWQPEKVFQNMMDDVHLLKFTSKKGVFRFLYPYLKDKLKKILNK